MIKLKPLLPALAGALIAAMSGPPREMRERALEALAGFTIAMFCTEPLLSLFDLAPDKFAGGVGFVAGLFGMTVAQALLRIIRDTDWITTLFDRFGGRR